MKRKDYYATLGIKKGSGAEEIRKAYRRLARKYHPDVNPHNRSAEEEFKSVSEAYDVLGDAKKRKIYDQYGFYSDQVPSGGPGAGAPFQGFDFSGFDFTGFGGGGGGSPPHRAGSSFRDIFSQIFSGGGESAPRQNAPQAGRDLEHSLRVDFRDAIQGTKVRIRVLREETCRNCSGSGSGPGGPVVCPECGGAGSIRRGVGALQFNMGCPQCGGAGRLPRGCAACRGAGRARRQEKFEVRVPPGVQTGSRIRLAGKGNAGTNGGPPGDLYIVTEVVPHPYFDRKGDNIYTQVPVTVSEAALGAKIEVPTLDGRAVLKVPPGTQSGQKFRLRGKGAPSLRGNQRGDHYVEVQVRVPRAADERTREILRELARLNPEDPRKDLKSVT
ncbi:MAG: molecular chaperone DnaJ [Acidobacteria bacterium]|nr:molecular chaperone DnaJ [Acidobacteriota bacterium]